jgi:hypothetical protein
MLLMHVYFLVRIKTLLPPAKEKKIHGGCIIKTLQENQTHVVIQQIISHQKTMFPITFVQCIPMGHSNASHVAINKHSCWTINNDYVHRKLDYNTTHTTSNCDFNNYMTTNTTHHVKIYDIC